MDLTGLTNREKAFYDALASVLFVYCMKTRDKFEDIEIIFNIRVNRYLFLLMLEIFKRNFSIPLNIDCAQKKFVTIRNRE